MTYEHAQLDALGDGTRRAILARLLLDGAMAVGDIAREFHVTRPAVSQHLRVLKDAQLVQDHPEGTRRVYQLDPRGFHLLQQYLRPVLDAGAVRVPAPRQRRGRPAAFPGPPTQPEEDSMTNATQPTVKRSVIVRFPVDDAFRLFTEGSDAWWPRTHHIGRSPMTRGVIEGRVRGRCYSEQQDGTECDWDTVLAWEPPVRLVLAWQITHQWGYEPDMAKASEVEVRFTPEGAGTRVGLEHRYFERHGEGGEVLRQAVSSPGGWGTLLDMYAALAAQRAPGGAQGAAS